MTRLSRHSITWFTWLATVVVTTVMLLWVSVSAMQSERDQLAMTVRAENERLALWRMESHLLPLISRESAWNGTSLPWGVNGLGALTPGQAEWGPGDQPIDTFVRCRFHLDRNGQVWPKPTAGSDLAQSGSKSVIALNELSELADEDSVEDAFAEFRLRGGNSVGEMAVASVTADINQVSPLAGDLLQQQRMRDQNEFNSRAFAANTNGFQSVTAVNNLGNEVVFAQSSRPTQPLISCWVNDQLLLARLVASPDGTESLQGCVLDWQEIHRTLCHDVRDLLPEADLVALANDAEADNHALATIPARLVPGAIEPLPTAFWSPMRVSLLLAWIGFAICAAAVGILLVGLMRLSQRRADFVSAVSHELRTPLTTFRVYTDLLADNESLSDEKRERYLKTLRRETTRLTSLVDNVLGFSRLETAPATMMCEPICWSTFFESIEDSLQDRAQQAGLTLRFTHNNPDAVIEGNAGGLERILFNLVDNAAKYAADSQPATIEISSQQAADRFEVRVSDCGPGISKAAEQRLFRPFSKSATEAAQTVHGVGLGLFLSRQLAQDMRGKLTLDHSDSSGATFVLQVLLTKSN